MHTILTDNQVTRNRRVHYVMDGEDVVMFSAPTLKDCLEWAQENDLHDFYLDFGDYRVAVRLPVCPWEGDIIPLGWLHRPKGAEVDLGSTPREITPPVEE